MISRRGFIAGLFAAPVIVRASSISLMRPLISPILQVSATRQMLGDWVYYSIAMDAFLPAPAEAFSSPHFQKMIQNGTIFLRDPV